MSESLARKAQCECWSNPETGQLEACSVHEPWFMDYAYTISDLRQATEQQAGQIKTLREALRRAEMKLSAYVGVCKDDKELTGAVLPMVAAALAQGEQKS